MLRNSIFPAGGRRRGLLAMLLMTLAVLTAAPQWANSQNQHIVFKHLTTDDGLSQISVNSIYIDEHGEVWIATREGLNRYNGHHNTTYRMEKNNPNSLFCNSVTRLAGNGRGRVYVLCSEGLALFTHDTEQFTTLLRDRLNSLCYHDGLYVSKESSVMKVDETTGELSLYYTLPDVIEEKSDIVCMLFYDHRLYLGTKGNGLYCLDTFTREISHPIRHGQVACVYADSGGTLWVGTWEHGLFQLDPARGMAVSNFRHEPGNVRSLSSDFVRACCEDNLGNLWIGTFHGLDRYDRITNLFQHHTAGSGQHNGLTHNSVWCIEKDRQGNLWLGTYFGGVNYFNPECEIFTLYGANEGVVHTVPQQQTELSYPVVGRMVEDEKGNLWIATEGGGVNYYDRQNQRFEWFREQEGVSHNNIKSLYYDPEHQLLWIGTHMGGLNRLDVRTRRITHYRMKEGDEQSLPDDIIRDIIPYGDSLIVATQNGVCLFDTESGRCRQLFRETAEGRRIRTVVSLCFDREGALWLATNGEGIYRYRFDTGELTNFRHHPDNPQSLSNNIVSHILIDRKERIWVATLGSGLDLFRPESGDFQNFDRKRYGLENDCIYRLAESNEEDKLLLITNGGFTLFDTNSHIFTNYNPRNGFPLSSINENALCLTRDGEVFLGSIRGMVSFYEEKLNFPPKPYDILFSRLIVNGKEIRVGDLTGILPKALQEMKEIVLTADKSMFSIECVTTNYVVSNEDELLYRLEGFSKEWTSTLGNPTITYTNLYPGSYRLVVKPSREESLCRPVSLIIRILPPWYMTWWAFSIYAVVGVTLIVFWVRSSQARIRLSESLKYEQQRTRDIEALNQMKLRFFTNISHEFRTPLTLILSQVETLMQKQDFTPTLYNKVLGIYKNCQQLKELITELLDFRKQEQGHMHIKVRPHDFTKFLYENYLLFNEYAVKQQIQFRFEERTPVHEMWYDQKQMQKVVNNLLSNALKHCPANGSITLGVDVEEQRVICWVEDTGCGIPADELDKIFNRFYQATTEGEGRESGGTGIGLALTKGIVELHHGTIRVESELHKRTRFVVNLPMGREAFLPEEIDPQEKEEQPVKEWKPNVDEQLMAELEENSPKKRNPEVEMLIVEDNAELREMLAQLFAPFYRVRTAADGEEGWASIQERQPHIVVSDVVMPRLSGTELCKRIKEDFNTCHIPVVLLTARAAVEQNIEGLRLGADDYITKPFHTGVLVSRCNNLVNSRSLLLEKFSKQPQTGPHMLATNPIDKELLDRALDIIERHMDDANFNVATFAREMGMARTNLFAKLKAITGQTPNDFILTIRLKKGAELLLKCPELNVTEISERIGFSTPRYFAKCFKDAYQVSPLAYRKNETEEAGEDKSSPNEEEIPADQEEN